MRAQPSSWLRPPEYVPCCCLPGRCTVHSFHADEPSRNIYADRQDAILCVLRCGLECGKESRFVTSDQVALFRAPRVLLHQSSRRRLAPTSTPDFKAVQV